MTEGRERGEGGQRRGGKVRESGCIIRKGVTERRDGGAKTREKEGRERGRQGRGEIPQQPKYMYIYTSIRCMSLAQVTMERVLRYGDTGKTGLKQVMG